MKPTPTYDFDLIVRERSLEEADHDRPSIFSGIFDVILNHQPLSITFVPSIRSEASAWPPNPKVDTDELTSAPEARLASIATGDYVVTPDRERAGQTETLPTTNTIPGPTIFYITDHEFALFSDELTQMSLIDGISAINEGVPISSVLQFAPVRQILKILFDECFSKVHRAMVTPAQVPS